MPGSVARPIPSPTPGSPCRIYTEPVAPSLRSLPASRLGSTSSRQCAERSITLGRVSPATLLLALLRRHNRGIEPFSEWRRSSSDHDPRPPAIVSRYRHTVSAETSPNATVPEIPLPPAAAISSPETDHPKRLRELIDTLDQARCRRRFGSSRKTTSNTRFFDDLEVNRSALQGMLNRLDFGAMLLTEKSRSERNSPFVFQQAKLTPQIGYVRFGRFVDSELEAFDAAIAGFKEEKGLTHLIHLRSPQAQAEFAIAAKILSRSVLRMSFFLKSAVPETNAPVSFDRRRDGLATSSSSLMARLVTLAKSSPQCSSEKPDASSSGSRPLASRWSIETCPLGKTASCDSLSPKSCWRMTHPFSKKGSPRTSSTERCPKQNTTSTAR